MTATDVTNALQGQNIQVASGVLDQPPVEHQGAFQIAVQTLGRLANPEDFGSIVVKETPGAVVRLKDVADVKLQALDYSSNSYLDHDSAVALAMFQRPGSNALSTADGVTDLMAKLSKRFPPGLKYDIVYNPTQFIRQSVDAVIDTIFEAIVLVVLVVILFLQTWRAAIIPLVAIPVSLIGTFFFMAAFGFTLNNLSLVRAGAGHRHRGRRRHRRGRKCRAQHRHRTGAARSGAQEHERGRLGADRDCAGAVRGVRAFGVHHRHIRAVLSPVRADHCRRHGHFADRFADAFAGDVRAVAQAARPRAIATPGGSGRSTAFSAISMPRSTVSASGISWLATRTVRRAAMMVVIYLVVLGVGLSAFRKTPTGFIPPVDRGYIIVVVQLPPGASLSRTDAVQQRALDIAFSVPGVAHAVNVVGFSGATFTNAPNSGALFLVLDDYSKRGHDPRQSAPAIQAELNKRLSTIQDAFIVAVLPPPVMGIGTAGGFRMMVEDRAGHGAAALREAASALMARANATAGLSQVFTLFETSTPQVYLDIDRTKAQLLGINVQDVFNALQIFIGSSYVNDFNLFGRTFRVTAQAREEDRQNIADVLKIRVRNANGDTVPLGSFTTVTDIAGPYRVPRYNLFPAAEIDGAAAPGYSQGQAIAIMDKLAADTLPDGFATEWTTLAFQQIRAGNTAIFAFVLAVVFVFLVLAAQYESLTLPLAVIMIVPMCLVAAITGVILRGQDNNILTQVGFVVLIGLAAKNAILIVEFARQLEDQGRTRWDAAVEATRLRLRPILMTSFAFILGVTPLVWAIGAGAELRQTLGTAVFAGMIGVTAFGLVFTPVFYVIARWIAELGPVARQVAARAPSRPSKRAAAVLRSKIFRRRARPVVCNLRFTAAG